MTSKTTIPLQKVIESLHLSTLCLPKPAEEIFIASAEVNRPGLQLAGFFEVFDHTRVQVLGKTEITYLEQLSLEVAIDRTEHLFSLAPPVVIIAHGEKAPPLLLAAAEKFQIPLLWTNEPTSPFMAALLGRLSVDLAPRITRHGVLMEIYGDGVLILGESGVGKSETAIELIARGHRLVADDAVEIRKVSARSLVGTSPDNIRHFMELRGVGIINAHRMYGMRAVKITEKIVLIVQLEKWREEKAYDRLGAESEKMSILDVEIPCVTVPVKPGRNLAVIIEAAAMNQRLKKLGYSAPHELMRSLGMPDDELPPPEAPLVTAFW